MFKSRFAAFAFGAALLSIAAAQPAAAQTENQDPSQRDRDGTPSEQVLPGRIGGDRTVRDNDRRRRREERPQAPTPEQLREGAQAVANALGSPCQVTEAQLLGALPEGGQVYEAVCAEGPGWLLVGSTPPGGGDCISQAGGAVIARETDPTAEPGLQCTLPANQNHLPVIADYARAAGVPCEIDEGLAVAQNRYEVGCPGTEGFWVERNAEGGWQRVSCVVLAYENKTCRFTTPEEIASVWPRLLTGTPAADCTPQETRVMGLDRNENIVIEVKCAADRGFIVRVDQLFSELKEAITCTEGRGIGGGCTLSTFVVPEGESEE